MQTKCVYDERMFASQHSDGQEKYNGLSKLVTKDGNTPDPNADEAEEYYFEIMKNMNSGNEKTCQKKSTSGDYQEQVKFFMFQNK